MKFCGMPATYINDFTRKEIISIFNFNLHCIAHPFSFDQEYIDGLVQEKRNFNAIHS